MTNRVNVGLKFVSWPEEDRAIFLDLVADGPVKHGTWAHLSRDTIKNRRDVYGRWLGFLCRERPELLAARPAARVTRDSVKAFVLALRISCIETSISKVVQHLYQTISAFSPSSDFDWLFKLSRRIGKRATPLPKPHIVSADLYRVGIEMMDEARADAMNNGHFSRISAEKYRDGLMIAVLVEAPMRRQSFTGLCVHRNITKIGGYWRIFLVPAMVKTAAPEDFELSEQLGSYVQQYLNGVRPLFPNAHLHNGMWPYGDRPMDADMVRRYVRKHTTNRLGVAVSPHGFRRAAASFIVAADPKNIRAAKDLLQHRTFAMTEKHYITPANTRRAGNRLAEIIARSVSSFTNG